MNFETIQDKKVRIRKIHRCYSCLRKFDKGTTMRYWFGKYEGDLNAVYSCLTCDDIMALCPSDGEGYPEGFVFEMLGPNETPEERLKAMKL